MAGGRKRRDWRSRVWVGVVLAALMVLVGCGGSSGPDSSSTSISTTTSADSGQASPETRSPGPQAEQAGADGGKGAAQAEQAGADGGMGSAQPGQASGHGGKVSGGKGSPRVPQPKGQPEPQISPTQRSEATVASMALSSPVSVAGEGRLERLPPLYTCDGKNTSPALQWQGVPQGTVELALFAMNVQPVNGKLFFDWAVAGLDPELEEIEAGKLPKGAVVGRNSFGDTGYKICPEGAGEIYMFALYALPEKLSPAGGFDPHDLRQAALDASGNVGLLPLTYARG